MTRETGENILKSVSSHKSWKIFKDFQLVQLSTHQFRYFLVWCLRQILRTLDLGIEVLTGTFDAQIENHRWGYGSRPNDTTQIRKISL